MSRKRLTEEVRRELKKPLGLLLHKEKGSPIEQLKEILEERQIVNIIVVGDYTTRRVLERGLDADVYILDNKTMRKPTQPISLDLEQAIHVRNPAGEITKEAWIAVKQAIQSKKRTKVMVDGEEDLLTLPAILFSPIGSLVIYGQPKEGLVVVEVSKKKKDEIKRIIGRMEGD